MATVALHRDKLIQAAIRLYREKGYANTGLSEILKLSGAPKGSLYHYFPGGKEELTAIAVTVAGQVVARTLLDLLEQSSSPQAFVAAYCELLAGWMEGSRFKSGCPIATTVLEAVPFSARITQACQAAFGQWINIIAPVFERAGLGKQEAQNQAEHVIATIEGALLLARLQQSAVPIRNLARWFDH